ncbi:xanthine dehydrogenase family protein molybdopterin-binding subunit [Paraburkholderia sp. SIMBA_055]|jgi:isoquinoline 1-oxidoreductase beta subunit|uniref:Aldehyde oxidase and xanthine dehydrogenase molybdopterin binding n=1 Tax=Paraburkholderia graminis (strain ATCC 700544 / DSM 17151 / LMG 18924 / NCIMB 13744 / C4D1M) TaxID=396598 RepID=B1FTW7_PARG4|nr:xanthine dehydrogenase family protein molybdopterin-binding subunit [Paraburkholderia graminis]ALE56939.1 aldehyde oxidase [Burkholderia sp. HB1]EDT12983.1 aldehyde oxidase and xanthine dehydrogenase molybdopterin binding [Paraburkholderia graminis C4D1M]CAB3730615.1 Isoquinoline 1-oxidoreductase subunit beta [Paraburkholderia graminis C4D1M]
MTTDLDLPDAVRPSRRTFLKAAGAVAAVGLTIGFEWAGTGRRALAATAPEAAFAPNAFLRVAPDNSVTVIAKHVEMGQGAYTGIATIVAEELDANWQDVRVESAPADAKRYANLAFGMQGTGGSSAMANSWMQLREAGAKARAMLVSAAAAQWRTPASELTTRDGSVHHAATNRTATYGSLASAAARLPVPDKVALKSPKDFRLIGHQAPRVDVPPKTDGTAQFTLDVTFPGMLVALLQRPPLFGATVRSFDASAAKAVPGVVSVVQVPGGVAVVAKGFWAAKQGRDALKIEWDDSKAEKRSSDAIMAEYRQLAEQPGASARKDGDATQALAGAAKKISATYSFPYLAHAPMEPLDAVVKLTADSCEIWAGDQFQTVDQGNAARTAGLDPQQVKIHTLYAGGSFGRRANARSDYIVEAVSIARALGANGTPVKLQWTREDDIHGGFYRPMYFHKLDAGLSADGKLVGWRHRIVGQSILGGTPFASAMIKNGIDATSVEGAANMAYAIPNISVELTTTQTGVPVLWWRVVGSSHTAFAVEAFIDEAAHAAGKDPFVFRRDLLAHEPRMRAVLELAARKAGWDPAKPLPKGRGRGIAVAEAFKTFVAQVAEVSVDKDGNVKIERVVCAVDCGTPINPDIIAAQMEGGIGFGLGAVLHSAITLKDGKVEQNNFDGYQVLRIAEMPKVEVHIVPSGEAPTGVGEPGVAPVGPAVANAIFAATGERLHSLPFPAAAKKSA